MYKLIGFYSHKVYATANTHAGLSRWAQKHMFKQDKVGSKKNSLECKFNESLMIVKEY